MARRKIVKIFQKDPAPEGGTLLPTTKKTFAERFNITSEREIGHSLFCGCMQRGSPATLAIRTQNIIALSLQLPDEKNHKDDLDDLSFSDIKECVDS